MCTLPSPVSSAWPDTDLSMPKACGRVLPCTYTFSQWPHQLFTESFCCKLTANVEALQDLDILLRLVVASAFARFFGNCPCIGGLGRLCYLVTCSFAVGRAELLVVLWIFRLTRIRYGLG